MPVRMTALALLCLAFAGSAEGASLSVSPIGIDRLAPAATAALTLRNTGSAPVNVQARVFRWVQRDGVETLEPTRDVAVSPPMTTLDPGVDYTVRVVRLNKAPVAGEEAYRIFVDELPNRTPGGENVVQFVVRYSIPVFFRERGLPPADVAWSARITGGGIMLQAANRGGTRLKAGRTTLRDSAGREFELSAGLTGYVLAGASMAWTLPVEGGRRPSPGPAELAISADGETLHVPISLHGG